MKLAPVLQPLAFGLFLTSMAPADTPPVSVPVKVRYTLASDSSDEMPGMQQPPLRLINGPTMPDGRLPQYQLDHRHKEIPTREEINNPKLRFLLTLPEQPLLIEAIVTIDGEPFGMARERRIEQMLIDATRPEPQPDEPQPKPPAVAQKPAVDGELQEKYVSPPTVPEYTLAETATEILRRYIQAIGSEISRDEVHWLLINRIDGPIVLELNANFQRFRAGKRPVYDILDRDRDGIISAKELAECVKSFEECDLNRDQIVTYLELDEVASDPRLRKELPKYGVELIQLTGEELDPHVLQQLKARYGMNGSTVSAMDANLLIELAFNTSTPNDSTLTLKSTSVTGNEQPSSRPQVETNGTTLAVNTSRARLEFSALQLSASDQISIGVVQDGYPILPTIDPNHDGRFTIRELRELRNRLQTFDRDNDGQITAGETQTTIRVCFGLGPGVHQELADIRSVTIADPAPTTTGPEWFRRMDRNKDGDLTRGEFPGTDEQFANLDTDADNLISADEANKFEEAQNPSPPAKAESK
ncbi:EF-hand domain-containing protein [Thalassoroseus pseudoceratinae]|uniref:EF-hand domain-containing protein n=1 Tax=Thalassoroseus pseudoceratinae TaxID=2713176 RepID=UPI0014242D5E|nr:EF-hand domain-containing protein [Thalassoroseus pseudoceratinae]